MLVCFCMLVYVCVRCVDGSGDIQLMQCLTSVNEYEAKEVNTKAFTRALCDSLEACLLHSEASGGAAGAGAAGGGENEASVVSEAAEEASAQKESVRVNRPFLAANLGLSPAAAAQCELDALKRFAAKAQAATGGSSQSARAAVSDAAALLGVDLEAAGFGVGGAGGAGGEDALRWWAVSDQRSLFLAEVEDSMAALASAAGAGGGAALASADAAARVSRAALASGGGPLAVAAAVEAVAARVASTAATALQLERANDLVPHTPATSSLRMIGILHVLFLFV
jgi:hypothetical protein